LAPQAAQNDVQIPIRCYTSYSDFSAGPASNAINETF
jgi:hypothetical protein